MSPSGTLFTLNLEPGTVIANRYEVQEKIGSGGMGMVFRVVDRELRNEIAVLKLLHPHLAENEDVFKRFLNEVLVARSLSHPNIVRIHDIGKAEAGFYYISMEFVDGFSLKDRIEQRVIDAKTNLPLAKLTFREGLKMLCDVASGVAYAHDKGVIHRDLKPANVLISNRGEVKLADFGTARIVGGDTSLTQAGQVIGTPDYMSPEQIRGEALDSACDIYSLGIMAYELATGKKPFVADAPVAIAFKHLSEPIPDFASEQDGIPVWFQELVKRCGAKSRTDRPASALEFLAIISQQMPDLGLKSGIYHGEKSAPFRSSTATTLVNAAPDQPTPGAAIDPGATTVPGSGSQTIPTIQAVTTNDSVQWRFDADELRKGVDPAFGPWTKKKRSNLGIILTGVVLLAVAGAGYVFKDRFLPEKVKVATNLPPTPLPTSSTLAHRNQRRSLEEELIDSITERANREAGGATGLSNDAVKQAMVGALTTGVTTGSAGESGEKIPSVSPNPTPIENGAKNEPTPPNGEGSTNTVVASNVSTGASNTLPPDAPTVAPTLAPTVSPSVAPSVSPTNPPPSPAPQPTAQVNSEPLKSVFFVRRAGGTNSTRSLSERDLDDAVWSARFSGGENPSPESLAQEVFVSASFMRDGERVTEKLRAAEVKPGARAGEGARLGGSLSELGHVDAGKLQLRLLRGENVLANYLLQIEESFEQVAQTPAPFHPEVVVSATPVPREIAAANQMTSNGLPAAQGGGMAVVEPAQPEVTVSAPQIYRGSITQNDVANTKQSLTLELRFAGNVISGTANISGVGDFKIDGEVFPRGLNFYLRGPGPALRFTSGKPEAVLRGSYAIAGEQKRFPWEAHRAQ